MKPILWKKIDYNYKLQERMRNVHECVLRIKFFDLLNQLYWLYTLAMGGRKSIPFVHL